MVPLGDGPRQRVRRCTRSSWAGPQRDPMTYMLNGAQYIVLAYGTANEAGLVGLATN